MYNALQCVRKKVNYYIHFHNSDKQCRILSSFCTDNVTFNCKQITKYWPNLNFSHLRRRARSSAPRLVPLMLVATRQPLKTLNQNRPSRHPKIQRQVT